MTDDHAPNHALDDRLTRPGHRGRRPAHRAAPRAGAWRIAVFAGLLALTHATAHAQAAPTTPAAPPATQWDAMQLDQMLAPIALYPDELLGPILIAACYPLEIVEADRWLQDPANAALRGTQLAQALQRLPWDASVKTLVAFPQVLSALDNNLEWTTAVGDAFVAQQAQVMDRIQQLRARAEAARTLVSSPQQVVRDVGPDIEIHPADAGMVYVPEYDPNLVYGTWPYLDNPPADFELPDYVAGGFIGFVVLAPYWDWSHWDWHRHRIGVLPPGAPRPPGPGPLPRWRPDPGHRRGDMAHASAETRARVARGAGPSVAAHAAVPGVAPRGFPPPPGPAAPPDAVGRTGGMRTEGVVVRPRAPEENRNSAPAHETAPRPTIEPGRPVERELPRPARPARPAEPVEGEHAEGARERR